MSDNEEVSDIRTQKCEYWLNNEFNISNYKYSEVNKSNLNQIKISW